MRSRDEAVAEVPAEPRLGRGKLPYPTPSRTPDAQAQRAGWPQTPERQGDPDGHRQGSLSTRPGPPGGGRPQPGEAGSVRGSGPARTLHSGRRARTVRALKDRPGRGGGGGDSSRLPAPSPALQSRAGPALRATHAPRGLWGTAVPPTTASRAGALPLRPPRHLPRPGAPDSPPQPGGAASAPAAREARPWRRARSSPSAGATARASAAPPPAASRAPPRPRPASGARLTPPP
ncbi:translation initiation factor IF-2-like [Ochotona curzoniae]|uniref:translation initiation factor IF-2-like n=1 Tax=Ochotona curzoniae TaxID=130825 RepID=UPI001B3476AC|nr:translation initiation factor IF-2-like [Ochotona curzoniae]